jgi:cold-inducible RNA-binding protein
MTRKLFVANFPYSTTTEQLQEMFEPHGQVVHVKIATDRESGRSRGFGFVEMETEEACQNAIRKLDGFMMGGRPLAVRQAEDRPGGGGDRGPRPGGGGRFGAGPRGPGRGPGGGGGYGGGGGGYGGAGGGGGYGGAGGGFGGPGGGGRRF